MELFNVYNSRIYIRGENMNYSRSLTFEDHSLSDISSKENVIEG